MLSTRKKKNQQDKQLKKLNETLKEFIVGKGSNVSAVKNETLEQQTNGQHNDFEGFADSASQNQVMEMILTTKLEEQSATLSRLLKIACTTRFWQGWIKW